VIIGQDPPKKKIRKEVKRNTVRIVIDTVTTDKAERLPLDTIAMEQRKTMNELKEQIDVQKKQKK
jgi:hypothetical protein